MCPESVNQKVIAIIQARMSSSRLPGKVLMDIGGKPMLARVIDRSSRAKWVDQVVVATTTEAEDTPIVSFCRQADIPCYRGSHFDVLDRYYQAAKRFQADVIVRITADCPLIDPQLIDEVIEDFFYWGSRQYRGMKPAHEANREIKAQAFWDFAANRLPPPWKRTYPIGLDTEVCTFSALERAWQEAQQPYFREHVMPYLYEPAHSVHYSTLNDPQALPDFPPNHFKVLVVDHDPDYGKYRWTVDTMDDLVLLRQIYAHFDNQDQMSWLAVIKLFESNPQLGQINASVKPKNVAEIDARIMKK